MGLSAFTIVCSGKQTFRLGEELAGMLRQDVPAVFSKAKKAASSAWEFVKYSNNEGFIPYDRQGYIGSGTSEGLDWSIIKSGTGETRYEHVKLHETNDLSKESHGVFYGNSVNAINKAWSNRDNGFKISGERVDTYIIPYENAGYAGGYGGRRQNLNSITIVTQKGTNKIITGFPGDGYKYSIKDIIGGN